MPGLAAQCVANIDPQHAGQNADLAAIEAAMNTDLPPDGATLVTIRADLDSVGAMALLAMRSRGSPHFFPGACPECGGTGMMFDGEAQAPCQHCSRGGWNPEVVDRISAIAESDKFSRGGWQPRALPTAEKPWDETTASAEGSRPLAAIAAAVADFKVSLAERVAVMERWLLAGEEPAAYRARVDAERAEMIRALGSGEIQTSTAADGRIAVVESTHRAATAVGYAMAPVVVAKNPDFRLGGGAAHTKFTVCAFEARWADIKSALAELAKLEPGWGGSPTIGGSPQGVSSSLTTEQVVEVVTRHLR
jgi:hypothetical protein